MFVGRTADNDSTSHEWTPVAVFSDHHSRTIFTVDWSRPIREVDAQTTYIATGGADDAIRLIVVRPASTAITQGTSSLLDSSQGGDGDGDSEETTHENESSSSDATFSRTNAERYVALPPVEQAHAGDVNCVKYVVQVQSCWFFDVACSCSSNS